MKSKWRHYSWHTSYHSQLPAPWQHTRPASHSQHACSCMNSAWRHHHQHACFQAVHEVSHQGRLYYALRAYACVLHNVALTGGRRTEQGRVCRVWAVFADWASAPCRPLASGQRSSTTVTHSTTCFKILFQPILSKCTLLKAINKYKQCKNKPSQ